MNCQQCHSFIHQYIDAELEERDAQHVADHLEACSSCEDLFSREERCWDALRRVFAPPATPLGLDHRVGANLVREDRRRFFRAASVIGASCAAAAAAVVVAVVLSTSPDDPGPVPVTAPSGHEHGQGIHWAVGHFREMAVSAEKRGTTLLDEKFLAAYRHDTIPPDRLEQTIHRLFGDRARVAPCIAKPCTRAAEMMHIEFLGFPVANLFLDLGNVTEIGIYRLSKETARPADLKIIQEASEFRIARCRACHVATLERDEYVYIFVSRTSSVDDLIDFMRNTF